jgi:predicted glycosyltransferase
VRIWIDLSNSPHPLLFAPIAQTLESKGHEILVTARDNAQTVELARERWPNVEVIGGQSPGGRGAKAAAIIRRMRDLRSWAHSQRPDVALSHNSYAQIVAARSLRCRVVTAMDYEHQPSNHLAFRLAQVILMPEAIPPTAVRRQGANARKLRRYQGLKEELYLGNFDPDPEILGQLGIQRERDTAVVVLRTPPSRAIYHQHDNPLFDRVLETLGALPHVRCVVLVRHPEQRSSIARLGLENVIVPDRAIDTRSLMYVADAVIGAGGTMTREAALLGVPTFTMFAGRRPAVDRWLEAKGMLSRLTDPAQLGLVSPRPNGPTPLQELRERASAVEAAFIDSILRSTAK